MYGYIITVSFLGKAKLMRFTFQNLSLEIQAYKSPKLEQNQKQGWDELGLDQDLLGQPPKKILRGPECFVGYKRRGLKDRE